jgi:hypothetical protein
MLFFGANSDTPTAALVIPLSYIISVIFTSDHTSGSFHVVCKQNVSWLHYKFCDSKSSGRNVTLLPLDLQVALVFDPYLLACPAMKDLPH